MEIGAIWRVAMVKNKIAIKKDKSLTAGAKKIFGHIVKKAWITTDMRGSKAEIRDDLKMKKYGVISKNTIDFSGEAIWIEFTNGNVVEFSNSEWAWIKKADIDNSCEV